MSYSETLDFEVVKRPIAVPMGNYSLIVPGKVALVNDKTDQVLSMMSKNYRLFTNEEFMGLTERVAETFGLEVDHYASHKGGKKVLSALKMNGQKHEIMGHEFSQNMVIFDSRDGSKKLSIGSVGIIHRCSNMFTSTDVKFSVNHSYKLDEMLAEFELNMELFKVNQQARIERLERLAEKKINIGNVYDLIGGWVELSKEDVRKVANGTYEEKISTRKTNIINGLIESWNVESKDLGKNGFGLHNMTTHYFSNTRNKDERGLLFEDFGYKERETIEFVEAMM